MASNFIKVKDNKLYLDNRIQISPLGREFRFTRIEKDLKKPSKWLGGIECWCWIYTFIYLDTNQLFGFYYEYNNQFSHKL